MSSIQIDLNRCVDAQYLDVDTFLQRMHDAEAYGWVEPGLVVGMQGTWHIGCPGCGSVLNIGTWSLVAGTREKPLTLRPSILHSKEPYAGCGWHGWLTDGRFHL